MGKNISPLLQKELQNLDKDADTRRSAMKTLKSYVKELDSKTIPSFLAQVSESNESKAASGEHTISLYEVLARAHGRKIVPQIHNIMSTILKILTSSAGSFPLHQACSKVVPAIARYAIDPTTPDEEKLKIILSLSRPLSEALMGFPESLTSGAALCLKALVESDNWKFAHDEVVNDICLRVTGALEDKSTQTSPHMGLVIALCKHNSLILQPYARSLMRSGVEIMRNGVADGASQKQLNVVQMMNLLLKSIDSESFCSELPRTIEVLEKCRVDKLPFVRIAINEALQTARTILVSKGLAHDGFGHENSTTGSNVFDTEDYGMRKSLWRLPNGSSIGNYNIRSPRYASPESQCVVSFNNSPTSSVQSTSNSVFNRSVSRKLWKSDKGGVDVSLKDGISASSFERRKFEMGSLRNFSERDFEESRNVGFSETGEDNTEEFSGFEFTAISPKSGVGSSTPSPQRPQSQLTIDDIQIFSTPRKLMKFLQETNTPDSKLSESPAKECGNKSFHAKDSTPRRVPSDKREEKNSEISSVLSWQSDRVEPASNGRACGSESVASTNNGCEGTGVRALTQMDVGKKTLINSGTKERKFLRIMLSVVGGIWLIIPLAFLASGWIESGEGYDNLVPT
ncbi:hypothetical protein AMTRI_Chr03g55750 [Amborella trichopoda]